MKHLTLLSIALFMIGCAHEQTTMDRELALKLADKPEVIVANQAAPVINIYNGTSSGGGNTQPMADGDTRKNCLDSPVYNAQGKFSHYTKRCFGNE